MAVLIKLALSGATFCFALGYASRRRYNPAHRRWMALGLALAWCAPWLLAGGWALGFPVRPAYWLIDLMHGEGNAYLVTHMQRGLTVMTLLLLVFQAWLGLRRHPLHGPLAAGVIPLWLLSYVSGMFFYF